MRNYVIRRVLLIVPTLFIVSVLVFLSLRFIPGDVIDIMMSRTRDAYAGREALEKHLGLDKPLVVQYGKWVFGIVTRGDLGTSLYGGHSVTSRVFNRLPTSFELGLIALVISLIIALPIGIYSAIRQDGMGDYIGRSVAIIFISIPGFWTATMVIIERIFALPGMGNLLLDSLSDRDYPVISGINLVIAAGIVTINLATDLTYARLDPRVRYS